MSTVAFIYVRCWTKPRGFLVDGENLRGEITYPHLSNFGGATIAYQVHRQADGLIVEYAVGECSDKDRFSKTVGRILSTARLERNELCGILELPVGLEEDLQEMLVADYLAAKELAIKRSVNGEWVEHIELSDYMQPIHPGYTWDFSKEKQDE